MFAARKARNAFRDGQTAYLELAHYGLFEGGGSYPRSVCLSMMATTNPYQPGTPQHAKWEDGWLKKSGLRRCGTQSTGAK